MSILTVNPRCLCAKCLYLGVLTDIQETRMSVALESNDLCTRCLEASYSNVSTRLVFEHLEPKLYKEVLRKSPWHSTANVVWRGIKDFVKGKRE